MSVHDVYEEPKVLPVLPAQTLEGEPARAWCHECQPVHACKSIDALQAHMRRVHGKRT